MQLNEKEALVVLWNLPHVGNRLLHRLLSAFPSPSAVLNATQEELCRVGISPSAQHSIVRWKESQSFWETDINEVLRQKVNVIAYWEESYPQELKELSDYPLLLYVRGKIERSHTVSIIGTRTASIYGQRCSRFFASELANAGLVVISGLARGIDTEAHIGALEGKGRTWAVLGSGLSAVYPKENGYLAEQISESGAVISIYPMFSPARRGHFPIRNYVMSGLSHAILLVEAPEKSGAMITMDMARREEKALFSIPGRIDAPSFCGNHRLIQEGKAQLITSPETLLLFFQKRGWSAERTSKEKREHRACYNEEEKKVLESLCEEECDFETLLHRTGLPREKLLVALMGLVLSGSIREYPGKRYTRWN